MQPANPTSPGFQQHDWLEAVALLGGQRAAAKALPCAERTMRALCSGERKLQDGHLRDMAKALLAHADACRRTERKLTPAFQSNLTADQLVKSTTRSSRAKSRDVQHG